MSAAAPLFGRRLQALRAPPAAAVAGTSERDALSLAAWLEDKHIRQYPVEARASLRTGQPGALSAYLEELGAPEAVIEHLARGRWRSICSWLLCVALQAEHGDNRERCEAAALAPAQPAQAALEPDHADVVALAAELGVAPGKSALATLQEALKAARKRAAARPRPAVPPAAPVSARAEAPPAAAGPPRSAGNKRKKAPLAPLGSGAFPLGFATGSAPVDEASRVLRMLHVAEMRRLQDAINEVVVAMQELTADPKTDARLGKVGR